MQTAFNDTTQRFVSFWFGDSLVGIDILEIREIVPAGRVAPVPQAPHFVMGLINLRGQILPVLDIAALLGLTETRPGRENHIIIFKHREVGFMVDRIGDVVSLETLPDEDIPANIDPGVRQYMKHVIDLPAGILMVLDAVEVLEKSLTNLKNPLEIG